MALVVSEELLTTEYSSGPHTETLSVPGGAQAIVVTASSNEDEDIVVSNIEFGGIALRLAAGGNQTSHARTAIYDLLDIGLRADDDLTWGSTARHSMQASFLIGDGHAITRVDSDTATGSGADVTATVSEGTGTSTAIIIGSRIESSVSDNTEISPYGSQTQLSEATMDAATAASWSTNVSYIDIIADTVVGITQSTSGSASSSIAVAVYHDDVINFNTSDIQHIGGSTGVKTFQHYFHGQGAAVLVTAQRNSSFPTAVTVGGVALTRLAQDSQFTPSRYGAVWASIDDIGTGDLTVSITSNSTQSHQYCVAVDVYSNNGIVGIGEAEAAHGSTGSISFSLDSPTYLARGMACEAITLAATSEALAGHILTGTVNNSITSKYVEENQSTLGARTVGFTGNTIKAGAGMLWEYLGPVQDHELNLTPVEWEFGVNAGFGISVGRPRQVALIGGGFATPEMTDIPPVPPSDPDIPILVHNRFAKPSFKQLTTLLGEAGLSGGGIVGYWQNSDPGTPPQDEAIWWDTDGEIFYVWDPVGEDWVSPSSGMPSGTSFPSQPSYGNNVLFRRTDIRGGMNFFYDGTRWVSDQLFTKQLFGTNNLTTDSTIYNVGFENDYNVYLVAWHGTYYLSGSSATWVINLDHIPFLESSGYTNLDSASSATYGNGAASWYLFRKTLGIVKTTTSGNTSGNISGLRISIDEQAAAVGFYGFAWIEYRLIAT